MTRALIRWLETRRSNTLLREQINELPRESLSVDIPGQAPESLAVSMVEGWCREIVLLAVTSADGELAGYQIGDPSFHNWLGFT